ncbi:MAG TPA: hypothetical protein ENN29_04350 [Candidatus Hydrogenedentes bacterium]|nr:hypothetical protein [Candidatus Hydrogenedentota bacterium]
MTIQLILADIDGCISPEESRAWDGPLFERFAQMSRDASAGAIKLPPLTLCTGRPQPYVEALMKILDIRFPAICEAGAVVYSLEDNCSRFAPEITQDMILGLHRLRDYIVAEILPEFPGLVYQFGKEAQMSLFSKTPECFAEVAGRVEAFASTIPGLDLVVTPTHYYLNIDFKGVTKGAAIQRLMRELGLNRDEAAGIGDTLGDISIREAVAFFACPANAVNALKETADYVSPYPDIRGVLDILKRPELSGAC